MGCRLGAEIDLVQTVTRSLQVEILAKQVLLIHASELNAECLDALFTHLERRGYRFRQLDAGLYGLEERIRVRAYELSEERGKRDDHALEDWLQAEAEVELAERKSLRAAA